jgi:flagellar biosynthesis protein FlhB
MANDPSRTEKATSKRRQKARNEGSRMRVPDLDASIMLWGNLFLFLALGSTTLLLSAQQMRHYLSRCGQGGFLVEGNLHALGLDALTILLRIVLPFMCMNFLLAIVNQVAQHGFQFNLKPLTPNFSKLNPGPGFKRLFSVKALMDTAKSLAKFAIVVWVAYSVLVPRIPVFLSTLKLPLAQSLLVMEESLFLLYRNVMLAMLFIAGADWAYQKHAFEKSIMMTKQEIKDEAKDSEGNPQIKGRQKQLMFTAAMHRIRQEVPKASVVITNPTHFAVALRYDEKTAAPVCVAKGADHLALKIREMAKVSGVTIVENPPLARALWRTVDVDKPIPQDLYQAVAQVLAFVYRLRGAA